MSAMDALMARLKPNREIMEGMFAEMGLDPEKIRADLIADIRAEIDLSVCIAVKAVLDEIIPHLTGLEAAMIAMLKVTGDNRAHIRAINSYLVQDPKRPYLPPDALDGVDLYQPELKDAAE